eukprot:GHVR01053306.1.p1 GENE.GHVR01053306.1~~GHVR01053306.1.p1  ORF type:complete len:216 (-),score=18.58 GHVR01053306.1:516-1163(-)
MYKQVSQNAPPQEYKTHRRPSRTTVLETNAAGAHPTCCPTPSGPMELTDEVCEQLRQKHPQGRLPHSSTIHQPDTLPALHPIDITGSHIAAVARRIQGGHGPGGTDANHWQDALLRHGGHSTRLRDAVASLARRLANGNVPWDDIQAQFANRLIAIDKCPGVRPIAIGESLRRLIAKAIVMSTKNEITKACCWTSNMCWTCRGNRSLFSCYVRPV